MANPDQRFVAWNGVQTYFVNKLNGAPLAAGYVKFFRDAARTVAKNVYQLTSVGVPPTYTFVNIGSTIPLNAVGCFQSPNDGTDIQVFGFVFDGDINTTTNTSDLYYMEIYSSDNVLQETRQAQPANALTAGGGSPSTSFQGSDNQIENPQFAVTLLPANTLTQTFSVTTTGQVTNFAPDWSIVTNGVGTVTITQLPLSDTTAATSPPFSIRINATGISSLKLRQTITQSPRIFGNGSNNAFVNGSLVAKSFGAAVQLIMDYVPSNAATVNLVTASTTADGQYNQLKGSLLNPTGSATILATNPDTPITPGYVNIDITIPVTADVGITSIQVASVNAATATLEYIQESVPRQIDNLFHYYNPQLQYKPIPSVLVGWDFPTNPAQFGATGTTGAIGATKSVYAWDQTILFSTVTSGLAYARAGGDTGLAFQVTPASNTSWAMIQYIPAAQARELLSQRMAVALRSYATTGTLTGTVSLWYTTDANLPSVIGGTNNSLVVSIAAGGVPTCGTGAGVNGTWVQVARPLGNASFTLTGTLTDFNFNGWQDTVASSTATFVAIVVAFDTTLTTQAIVMDYVSLCQGDIATRPSPKSPDQVIRECQYYYEKSYAPGVNPGTPIAGGCLMAHQQQVTATGSDHLVPASFSVYFNTPARVTNPTITIYSSDTGASGNVFGNLLGYPGPTSGSADIPIANWNLTQRSATGVSFTPANATQFIATGTTTTTSTYIFYHYTKDARLGIVN